MFLRLRLPLHSAYDDTFFWSRECRDNEVRLYILWILELCIFSEKIPTAVWYTNIYNRNFNKSLNLSSATLYRKVFIDLNYKVTKVNTENLNLCSIFYSIPNKAKTEKNILKRLFLKKQFNFKSALRSSWATRSHILLAHQLRSGMYWKTGGNRFDYRSFPRFSPKLA